MPETGESTFPTFNFELKMQKYVYYRIVGHVLTGYLQVSYFLEMLSKLDDALPTHPELNVFASTYTRLFTLLNVLYQVVYACLAFVCDVTTVFNMESIVLKWIRHLRIKFAVAFLFPMSSCVFCFWGWFLYDRELVLPKFLDIAISPTCNFLWHFVIFVYTLWEMTFLDRDALKPSPASLKMLITSNCFYIALLYYTRYGDIGTWPYDVLTKTEGTIFLYLVIGQAFVVTILAYHFQFRVKEFIWKFREEKKD